MHMWGGKTDWWMKEGTWRAASVGLWFNPWIYELRKPWLYIHWEEYRSQRHTEPFYFYCLFVFIFLYIYSIFWQIRCWCGSFSLFTISMWRCDFQTVCVSLSQLFLSLSRFFFSYIGWLTMNLPTERVLFGSFRPVKTKVVTLKDKIMDVETCWNEIFSHCYFWSREVCCWR